MKTVFTYGGPNPYKPDEPALIVLEQRANKLFDLTYGVEVTPNMPYAQAAARLGGAIMHHLACESTLDNTGP